MASFHLSIFLFSQLLLFSFSSSGLGYVSSTTISPEESGGLDTNLRGTETEFRKALAEFGDIIATLQDQIGTQLNEQEPQDARALAVKHLLRNKRNSDTALSLNYGSGAASEDLSTYGNQPSGGAIYTHWGRDNCTNGSELVYSGMAAGAYYSHTGGGVNYLCLPHEPIYGEVETSTHSSRSLLYNAEFETSTAQALQSLHDQTPACAVCRAPPTRLTKLMIPARNQCPSSKWRLEYKGYLMSSLYSHTTRTEFVCMDEDAMAVPGTTGNQHGALFYMVEARCSAGGIQCGPYVNGYELTCAVCTI